MSKRRATSERIYRDLTPKESARLEKLRDHTEANRDEILAQGRVRKAAWEATQLKVARAIAALRAERERLGLSLADIEARSGLKRSALSRLENDPNANPTLLTLQRYASAWGLTLQTTIEPALEIVQ